MKNILISGATGFIGSHILDRLLELNYNVFCLVRKSSNLRWIVNKNVTLIYTDFNNFNLDDFINIDTVIHVAGIIAAVDYSEFYKVNSLGTKKLIDAVSSASDKLSKIIYISSQTVGGPAATLDIPINENHKANPLTNYAKSKLEAENFVINNPKNINYTILRPSAVIGERDPGILQIFQIVQKGLAPLMGLDKKYLNLIYAKDLADATVNCIDNPISNNKIYYIAGNEKLNWDDLMTQIKIVTRNKNALKVKIPNPVILSVGYINELISKITKKPQIFNYDKAIDFTRKYWLCDTTKARSEINLKTEGNISEILKITGDWYFKEGWLK